MTKRKTLVRPTPKDDADIDAAIARDPDATEATAADFARARRTDELPPEQRAAIDAVQRRGRPRKSAARRKVRVNITLDRDVQEALRDAAAHSSSGGASTLINTLLRRELKLDGADDRS